MSAFSSTPEETTNIGSVPGEQIRNYQTSMPETGDLVGQNRILDQIAEGGMAVVYKARHEELEILRAIKILKPGFDENTKKRLRTEAKISAHLTHQNIVEVYGVHDWNGSVTYLEMEYVDGLSLRQLIDRQQRIPFAVAAAILYAICNALQYAHNQLFTLYGKSYEGIVHRDIKPANILLTCAGVPKLADFGIAKPLDISLHTVGQKVMGTFAYLSPEQLKGEPLDKRSDIYSLGIVLYECITGKKAFPQSTLADLIREKLKNQYKSVADCGIDIPKKLDVVLEKSTHVNRDKRYASGEDFAADLLDILKQSGIDNPQRLIADFLRGQDTVRMATIAARPKRLLRRAIVAGISLIAICAVLLIVKGVSSKHNALRITPVMSEMSTAQPRVSPVQPAIVDKSKKGDTDIRLPVSVVSSATVDKREQKKSAILDSGLSAYTEHHYTKSIVLLEKALRLVLPDSARQRAIVCLLDAYVSTKNIDAAQALLVTYPVADGYYHLLAGKVQLKLDKPELAVVSFGKALTVPSRVSRGFEKEAAYNLAKACDAIFTAKPNADNKHACVKAWQQFKNGYCSQPDVSPEMCREADDELKGLTE